MREIVGKNIRALRKAKGWTIEELAGAVDSDVGNISRLERGKQGFTDAILSRIATALAVQPAALFAPLDGHPSARTGRAVRAANGDRDTTFESPSAGRISGLRNNQLRPDLLKLAEAAAGLNRTQYDAVMSIIKAYAPATVEPPGSEKSRTDVQGATEAQIVKSAEGGKGRTRKKQK